MPGSLTVVGTGIALGAHLTAEARAAIERAEVFLYLVYEPAARLWLERLNPRGRSLQALYETGRPRREIYEAIVEEILAEVRAGAAVCAAFYGHPGVFAQPSHEAVRRASAERFSARMLPAVSAADCLFADLGVDPGAAGCQSHEATDLLLHRRRVDPTAALIVWQVSVIGRRDALAEPDYSRLPLLVEYLLEHYPAEHEVVVYEASPYPVADPVIARVPLGALAEEHLTPLATLYVSPARAPERDPEMAERLGLL